MFYQTEAIHSGNMKDEYAGAVVSPIYLSTTFERNPDGIIGPKGYIYTRVGNPNRDELERKLTVLEKAADAIAFPSGMAAVMAVFSSILDTGGHVIISDDCYHAVPRLLKKHFQRFGISFDQVDMVNADNVEKAIKGNTRLILVETPSNPQLKIADITAISAIAKKHKILLGCDNTWATPVIMQPIVFGADFVIHSTTKYFGGHSDLLGGCVMVKEQNDLCQRIRDFQHVSGVVPSAFDCWLLNRSISTMYLRVLEQSDTASLLATFLNNHSKIEKVFYPGLPDHPNHKVAFRQMNGIYGGMISILIKGDETDTLKFASKLKLFKHATSLGGVESLIEHRLTAEGEEAKSPPNLLRISIGLEHIEDLRKDIEQAFC